MIPQQKVFRKNLLGCSRRLAFAEAGQQLLCICVTVESILAVQAGLRLVVHSVLPPEPASACLLYCFAQRRIPDSDLAAHFARTTDRKSEDPTELAGHSHP